MVPIEMPWQPRSRQEQGGQTEKAIAKKRGARAHPRSGAGSIKWDASSEEQLLEMKDANRSHTLQGPYLRTLFNDAARQGKEAVYIVTFIEGDIEVECHIRRKTN